MTAARILDAIAHLLWPLLVAVLLLRVLPLLPGLVGELRRAGPGPAGDGVAELREAVALLAGSVYRLEHARALAALADALPGARLERVPGAGHFLPAEAPRLLADAVLEVAARGAEGQHRLAATRRPPEQAETG
jgi:pimeloyl-ACP methyl ester carboxylesterase